MAKYCMILLILVHYLLAYPLVICGGIVHRRHRYGHLGGTALSHSTGFAPTG